MASTGRVFKSVGHGLSVFLLIVVAFIGIAIITLSTALTDKERVKSWPQRAGVYSHMTDNLLTLTQHDDSSDEETEGQPLDELLSSSALDTETVESTIDDVYTPRYWQEKFEVFLDDVYAWLEGEQAELNYEIDFNDRKDELTAALTDEVADQLSDLPQCQPSEIPARFDVLESECLPPGVSPSQAAGQFERELTSADGALAQDLHISSDDEELETDTLSTFRNAYQDLASAPLVLSILLLLLIVLVAISGRTFINGLRRASLTLFSVGIISWIGFFLLNQLGKFSPTVGQNESERQIGETVLKPLARTITGDISSIGMWTSLTVVIIGALLWLGAYTWHKVHHHSEAEKIARRSAANGQPEQPATTLPRPVDPDVPQSST